MSSILRHVAQIPVRTVFFLVLQDVSAGASASESSALTLDAPWPGPGTTVRDATTLDDNATPVALTQGALYRDLGRQIIVADDTNMGAHVAHYRAALLVNGASTEGVGAFQEVYLRIWAADGTGVVVARTG